jgi:hypothetical protein
VNEDDPPLNPAAVIIAAVPSPFACPSCGAPLMLVEAPEAPVRDGPAPPPIPFATDPRKRTAPGPKPEGGGGVDPSPTA